MSKVESQVISKCFDPAYHQLACLLWIFMLRISYHIICLTPQAHSVPGECRAPAALVLTAVLGAHALPHKLFAGVLAEGLFWPAEAMGSSSSTNPMREVSRELQNMMPSARVGACGGMG